MAFDCATTPLAGTKRFAPSAATFGGKNAIDASTCEFTTMARPHGIASTAGGRVVTVGLSEKHLALLETERALDEELLVTLGVETCDKFSGDWIAIPFVKGGKVVNHKY